MRRFSASNSYSTASLGDYNILATTERLPEVIVERIGVTSSDISSIGYDSTAQFLEIEFQTGSIYQYQNVPISIYEGLMNAPSHGRFFASVIKKGPYSCTRVR